MDLGTTIKTGVNVVKNFLKTNRGEIELVAGNALIVTGFAFALKNGDYIKRSLDIRKDAVKSFKELHENWVTDEENQDDYPIEICKQDIRRANVRCAKNVAKKLAIPVGATLVGLIFTDDAFFHEKKLLRNATFALASVTAAFGNYRQRVVDELGENMDNHFMYGISAEEQEVDLVTVDENGNEVVTKETLPVMENLFGVSEFAFWWTPQTTDRYQPDEYYMKDFVKNTERYFNDTLVCTKKTTVNTIKDYLGCKQKLITINGQAYGWEEGDIIQIKTIKAARPIGDGRYEPTWLIDFNCHYILNKFSNERFTDDEFGDEGWIEIK